MTRSINDIFYYMQQKQQRKSKIKERREELRMQNKAKGLRTQNKKLGNQIFENENEIMKIQLEIIYLQDLERGLVELEAENNNLKNTLTARKEQKAELEKKLSEMQNGHN